MIRAAVFASGNGSNFQALVDAARKGGLGPASIVVLFTDVPGAYVRERARKERIPDVSLDPSSFASKDAYEDAVSDILAQERVDLILLAGYMRILGKRFVQRYPLKIINIHPSLLPLYKGVHSIERAFNAREKETGVTVHFVDEKVDHGPIILQERVFIMPGDTVQSLEERVHQVEHTLYPRTVRLYAEGRLQVENGSVKIL